MHLNVSKVGAEGMVPGFSVVLSGRMRSTGHKMKWEKFDLNVS